MTYVVDAVSYNPNGKGWRPGDVNDKDKIKELNLFAAKDGGGIMTAVCNRRAKDGWSLISTAPGMAGELLLFFGK